MREYRICYVTPDDHIAAAPVRFVRENDLAAVQYAQSLLIAILTNSGKAGD
jgi:hypothetical protein